MRRYREGLGNPPFFMPIRSSLLETSLVIAELPIKTTRIIRTAAIDQHLHAVSPPLGNNQTDFFI